MLKISVLENVEKIKQRDKYENSQLDANSTYNQLNNKYTIENMVNTSLINLPLNF